ncbi:FeoA family protein [Kordiimonas pumila]|uniref:Ferrous iron transport protein A n=1 Tax=Kordiimonas pumila TaxID=2161677 RepID=A0ABV7D8F6_9PROT|nr:FeoA family protein [Kordiimonas pumila]
MNHLSNVVIPLGALLIGSRGKVTELSGDQHDLETSDRIDRLREIGFSEGLDVELLHQSPFGKDPIAVRIGAMTVALRRSEANLIKVQVI